MTPKIIKSVKSVALGDNNNLDLVFEYEGGTCEAFVCPPERITDFTLRLNSLSMGQLSDKPGAMGEIGVAYEPGNGRVLVTLPNPDGARLQLAMGHVTARDTGQRMVRAADASASPVQTN